MKVKPKLSVKRLCWMIFLRTADLLYVPFSRLGIALIADRYNSVGNCRFWGPASLVDLSTTAMNLIAHEDSSLFLSLCSRGSWFWHHPTKLVSGGVSTRIYSVTDGYIKFGAHGLAARIVWAHFEMTAFKGVYLLPSERKLAADFHNAIRVQTLEWLQEHKFPEDLTNIFAENIAFNRK